MDDLYLQMKAQLQARQPFPEDATVLLAVSGGVDSMVMADLFRRLAKEWPLTLYAVHLDHGLRAESAEEARAVASQLEAWGIPTKVYRYEVASLAAASGESIEAEGHLLRRRLFRSYAASLGAATVLYAQHAEDRAETLLLNLLRGSGAAGLSALRYQEEERVRPLLFAHKAALYAYAEARSVPFWEDRSNASPRYLRNRIRHEVMPLLRAIAPGVDERLLQTAHYMEEVQADLEKRAAQVLVDALKTPRVGVMALDRTALEKASPPLRKELLLQAARRLEPDKRGFGERNLALLFAWLAEEKKEVRMDLADDWHFLLEKNELWLWVGSLQEDEIRYHITWDPNREPRCLCPGGDLFMVAGEEAKEAPWPRYIVRTPEPGDRIRIEGLGHKRIKKCFQEAEIPLRLRRSWPLLCNEAGEVLWIPGLSHPLVFSKDAKRGIIFKRAANMNSQQEDVDE